MTFSDKDKEFMNLALCEAKKALDNGDYPVGAVLVIDGKFIDKIGNSLFSGKDWASHAESSLLRNNSSTIKEKVNLHKSKVELFTTLEPCLMCLGSSILHNVSRIVYACSDPEGGATNLDKKSLPEWYTLKWPKIENGLFQEKSYNLMTTFIKNQNTEKWNKVLEMYKEMKQTW